MRTCQAFCFTACTLMVALKKKDALHFVSAQRSLGPHARFSHQHITEIEFLNILRQPFCLVSPVPVPVHRPFFLLTGFVDGLVPRLLSCLRLGKGPVSQDLLRLSTAVLCELAMNRLGLALADCTYPHPARWTCSATARHLPTYRVVEAPIKQMACRRLAALKLFWV